MTTSACDTCRAPGSCCRGLALNKAFSVHYWEEQAKYLMKEKGMEYFIPVRLPIEAQMDERVQYSQVYFDCTRLGADGRCTDYENRPDLCREYKPQQDPLCAEFVHTLKGIPIHVVTETRP